MEAMTEFFKSGDCMAIRTDASTADEFLNSVAADLSAMIERGLFENDWEFQLGYWLPQIVAIACALRGHPADVVRSGGRLTAGRIEWVNESTDCVHVTAPDEIDEIPF